MLNLLLCALRDIRRNFEQMLNAQVSEYRSAVQLGGETWVFVVGGGNDVDDP